MRLIEFGTEVKWNEKIILITEWSAITGKNESNFFINDRGEDGPCNIDDNTCIVVIYTTLVIPIVRNGF
jgi:hypothetical protein